MKQFSSLMTFLYFEKPDQAFRFFEELMELEIVFDPGWARVYKVTEGAFLGAVDVTKGSMEVDKRNGSLVSFTVKSVEPLFEKVKAYGFETTKIKNFEDLGLKSFFFKGPEGYDFEVQSFYNENLRKIF